MKTIQMKKIIHTFFILLPLLAFSCQSVKYATTKIQTLNPPTRNIHLSDAENIAIVVSLQNNLEKPDSILLTSLAMAIKDNLENSPLYSAYIFPVFTINTNNARTGLTQEHIADVKESSEAKFLISVESFGTSEIFQKEFPPLISGVDYNIEYKSKMQIYDANKLTVIDSREMHDTIKVKVNIAPLQSPLSKNDIALKVVNEIAKEYTKEIAPFWQEETRYYYTIPKMNAKRQVNDQQWKNAMNIWSKYVDDSNKTTAAIACFNMALACEMLGEYELAISWMENVKNKNQKYYWGAYKAVIEARMDEKEKIDLMLK